MKRYINRPDGHIGDGCGWGTGWRRAAISCGSAGLCTLLIAASNQAFRVHADVANVLIRWLPAAVFAVLLYCWTANLLGTAGTGLLSMPEYEWIEKPLQRPMRSGG